jgi:hemoglobin
MSTHLTEDDISRILARFYDRVKADEELGPVFAVVQDWDEHLTRLSEFWSSMMFTSGRYKGNPVSLHLAHAEKIRPNMFVRWLELWRRTTDELAEESAAKEMQRLAARIACRFSMIICGEALPSSDEVIPSIAVAQPCRGSPLFNERSLP